MKIRKATKEDKETIKYIWRKSKYDVQSDSSMEKALNKSFQYSDIYLIYVKSKPIGYMVITNKRKITYLNYIALIKSFQNKGFGLKIMKKVMGIARKNKSNKLQLAVFSKNFSAIRLYNKFNFYFIEDLNKRDKKLEKKIKMEKKLE